MHGALAEDRILFRRQALCSCNRLLKKYDFSFLVATYRQMRFKCCENPLTYQILDMLDGVMQHFSPIFTASVPGGGHHRADTTPCRQSSC
jgi:hypothetical protein